MKKIIKREKYFQYIEKFIWKDIVKIIVWQRRVWKSYILLQILEYLQNSWISNKNIVYINKEDLKFDFIKDYKDLYEYCRGYNHILIDEIQEIEGWEKAIRSLQNEWKDIYITWSNSSLLSSELATLLSGRYVSFHIYPLDYKEFLKFHNLRKWKKSFEKYIRYGWMPYLKNLVLDDEVYIYLNDVVNTVVCKDIIAKFKIRNVNFFHNLLLFLWKNIGNIFSAKNISDYLKSQKIQISVNTVLDYLSYLKYAFLIDEVKRFDLKGKKIFEVKSKYFFEDIWIRNAIVGWFNSVDIWGILENVVYTNLVSNGWKVYVWELSGYEIDFVCEKGNEKMFIQVCYLLADKKVQEREFNPLLKLKNSRPKYVLSLDEFKGWTIEWVKHQNIIDFIYNLDRNIKKYFKN